MANFLSVETISKTFGDRQLFKNISFGIEENEKIGLIAPNGSGKTTFLRILAGHEGADAGKVSYRTGVTVGFLDQDPQFDPTKTVLSVLFDDDNPVANAVRNFEMLIERNDDPAAIADASELIDQLNGWDYESKSKQILGKLGLHNLEQQVSQLSGGQVKRLALAKLLLQDPQLLILDEPTNHLDIEMIEWLESYLMGLNKTLLLVTHDRYFLDRIVDRIIELTPETIYTYDGNYEYFLEKKFERESIQNAEVDKAKNLFRRELEWIRKQPKARGTKQKARTDAFEVTKEKASQKLSTEKVELAVNMSRLGNKILELNNISKAYEDKVILKKFDYVFKRKERIGIIGYNGVGKSTFLNILQGLETIDAGMIETGETIQFGYYNQKGLQVAEDKRVIDVVKEFGEFITLGNNVTISASEFLNRFLFTADKQYSKVAKLSGGERRRLHLMTVLIKNPNFLILDEPTNDLDLLTLQLLEEFLLNFPGCLIVVTHDRYFMDRLVDHLFVFEGNGVIKDFNGTYSEYKAWKQNQDSMTVQQVTKPVAVAAPVVPVANKPSANKLSFKEKREYEILEAEISELEQLKEELLTKVSQPSNHTEIQKLGQQLQETVDKIELKSMRWLELSERI